MAAMAIQTAGHGGDGASFNTVFIDTTLDTHLAMHVSSSDTVADLKKKIIEEHPVCFPKWGAIRIDGLKVKRRGLYYHLAESMLVKSAFDGTMNSWFISVEASVIVRKGKETEEIRNYQEEANLASVDVNKNGLEDEGVGRGVVGDGGLLVTIINEPGSSLNQNGSRGVDILAVEVAETSQVRGGSHGDKMKSIGLVGSESLIEEKSAVQAQDMDVLATETRIDGSVLQGEDLNDPSNVKQKQKCNMVGSESLVEEKSAGQAQDMDVLATETRIDGSVLQGEDLNDPSNVKQKLKCKKRERSNKADDNVAKKLKSGKEMENEGRAMVSKFTEMTYEPPTVSQLPIGDEQQLVNATAGAPDADATKSSKKLDNEINASGEVSLKEARSDNINVVSEPNDMNCDPPTVSQLPIGDGQQLVNAAVGAKKKRKKKSSKKIDKEVNAVDEQSMNEAGGDNGNFVLEQNVMTGEPTTVSQLPIGDNQQVLNAATMEASDAGTKKKRKKKSSKKTDKEVNADVEHPLKEAGDGDGNVAAEPHHAPAIVQQEADEHMLQPSTVSLDDKDTSPVQEAHHINFPSQDVNDFQKPVPDEMHIVATEKLAVSQTIATEVQKVISELSEDVSSLGHFQLKKRKKSRKHKDSSSKDAVIDNPIREAAEKGSDVAAKEGEEAVVAESLRASLLVTDDEINEVIQNVVDSIPQATESKVVAEVKEWESKKKPKKKRKKKCDSNGKISPPAQAEDENTGENIPVPPNVNVQDDTNLSNTRTSNSPAKASKVGNDAEEFSNNGVYFKAYVSPTEQDKKTCDHSEDKLPEASSLTGKRGSDANPHVGSSGEENQNKGKEVQQPNAANRTQHVSKQKEAVEHHFEGFTNSASKPKRSSKVQPLTLKGNVKGGRGPSANTGEVLNDTARPKPLFGDGSDDSLETYVFPSLQQSPDPYSDISSHPDGESDAGFNGKTRKISRGRKGMKTPFVLKSSIGFKKSKFDAESQPDDSVPTNPSPSI